jgi:hypothetical protein
MSNKPRTTNGLTFVQMGAVLLVSFIVILAGINLWPAPQEVKKEHQKVVKTDVPAPAIAHNHIEQEPPPAPLTKPEAPTIVAAPLPLPPSPSQMTRPATPSPDAKLLEEIPPARPICATLVRNDANACASIEQRSGAEPAALCRESARARLEACNAGHGLPSLVFTPG